MHFATNRVASLALPVYPSLADIGICTLRDFTLTDRIRPPWLAATLRRLDSWISWGVVGFVIGLALGVNTLSVWLVAIGMGLFVANLALHGPARRETEGALFASGGVFMVAWIAGFVVRGLLI